jgi:hypothetical protein
MGHRLNFGSRILLGGILAISLAAPATPARAAVSLKSESGWTLSFDGFVNGFAVYQAGADAPAGVEPDVVFMSSEDSFRIRTGLLPGLFGFGVAAPKFDGLEVKARIGLYPQIQNSNTRSAFVSQTDLREIFFTVDGSFGQVLVGRALNLYQGKNILTDMTLFGVGAQGPVGSGGTTVGRIGYGYLYAQFGAQLRYTTPDMSGFKLAVSLTDPSQICGSDAPGTAFGAGCYSVTKAPGLEGELSYSGKSGNVAYQAWASGIWQSAETGGTNSQSVSATGAAAGVGVTVSGFDVLASGFMGKGLGSFFLLDFDSLDPAGNERDSSGFLGQATYSFGSTKLGVSYGQNSMKETDLDTLNRQTPGGIDAGVDTRSSITAGLYHDIGKNVKAVAEFTNAKTKWHGGADQSVNVIAVGGFFLW